MKAIVYSITAIIVMFTSCNQADTVEMNSENVTLLSVTTNATSAEIAIRWTQYYTANNKSASRLYYGTSPDSLNEYVVCQNVTTGSIGERGLSFQLTSLNPLTKYYFALAPAEFYVNDLIIYNNFENPTFIAPSDWTFNTLVGYETVDLGLSVAWCDKNVNSNSIEDGGERFTWCTDTKLSYNEEPPYFNISGTEYDNATQIMGENWRTPTQSEFQELIDNCEITVMESNGERYLKVVGPNGNDIILPVTNGLTDSQGNWCSYYWTSNCTSFLSLTIYEGVVFTYNDNGGDFSSHTYRSKYYIRAVKNK